MTVSALSAVQAQLDAYNAKNLDALLAAYAPDAEQFVLHGERLAQGHAQLRARYAARFTEPALHARLLSRVVMGSFCCPFGAASLGLNRRCPKCPECFRGAPPALTAAPPAWSATPAG